MKFDTKRVDEGMFPSRKPWLIVLIVIIVGSYPAYRLGVRVFHKGDDRGDERAKAKAVENGKGAGESAAASPAAKPAPLNPPAAPTVAAGVKPAASAGTATIPAVPPAAAVSTVRTAADSGGSPLNHEQFRDIISRGQSLEDRGEMLEAARVYEDAMKSSSDARQQSLLAERLGRANFGILMSRQNMQWKVQYAVKPNDAVEKLARKFGTTTELISRINGLGKGNSIRKGQSLMVFAGRFSIAISKSRFELVLNLDGRFFKRYSVCVGSENKTPVGSYVITSREVNPTWWPEGKGSIPAGDERNLLGTRWMAIKDTARPADDRRGLGIHGTRDESSIGKALSAGCVRMLNSDVEELHMLVPVGTPVVIAE